MSRPRSRPSIHFAYAGDWYDGPLEGLIRVDGRPGLLWFKVVSESPRGRRTYAAYETPPEFVTIIRAERKLFERLVYGHPTARRSGDGVPERWKRWYEVYSRNPVPRPPLGPVLFRFTDRSADCLPSYRHRWRKALADRA